MQKKTTLWFLDLHFPVHFLVKWKKACYVWYVIKWKTYIKIMDKFGGDTPLKGAACFSDIM